VGKKDKKKNKKPESCSKEGATSLRAIDALRMLGAEFPETDRETLNEILVVEGCAINIGAAGADRRQAQILLTGHPHPNMHAETAWILFYEGEEGHREPEYLDLDKRIVIYYPLSYFPVVESTLCSRNNRVWCQYREYDTGHRWADVHTWPEAIGNGK